jgi:hypothetical protein
VGEAARDPFGVAGTEVGGFGGFAFFAAAEVFASQIKVADGDEKVRAGVVMQGDYGAGLEFGFGDADVVFDEEDLNGAGGEDVQRAIFVLAGIPFGGGGAEGGVFEEFNGDIAEGLRAGGADDVGEGGGGEASVSSGEFDGGGGLVFYCVGDFGGGESDGDVVVTVPVEKSCVVGRDFNVEDADGFVFEGEVVVRFGGDFDFGSLSVEEWGECEEEYEAFHAGDCSRHLGAEAHNLCTSQ